MTNETTASERERELIALHDELAAKQHQFMRETLRTSEYAQLLDRWMARASALGCTHEQWTKACITCDLMRDTKALREKPINNVPLYPRQYTEEEGDAYTLGWFDGNDAPKYSAALPAPADQPPEPQGSSGSLSESGAEAGTQVAASALERAVIDAARDWRGERTIKDWAEADLARAIARLDGDWPGCQECDHQCGEPCMPATVEQQIRGIDCHVAQLVHDGKLIAPDGYKPPDGWLPMVFRGKRLRPNADAAKVSAQHGASDNSEQEQPKG